jgi:hypothetical protein
MDKPVALTVSVRAPGAAASVGARSTTSTELEAG